MRSRILTFSFLLFLFTAPVLAQNFEGTIRFRKSTLTDTTDFVYSVKGDKVRIDEVNVKTAKTEGSFLIDTKASTMVFLSPDRKTWGKRDPESASPLATAPAITQTKNKKSIQGYNCTEWVVKTDQAEISYWVAPGKFSFFMPMLKLLNRKEKFSTYYQALNPKAGSFSFLAIQTEGGKETGRLEVTGVEKKSIDAGQFEIPKDYKEFK